MKKVLQIIGPAAYLIFNISFAFYILFFIIDIIKPGFVSNFFYSNTILLICIIMAIISLAFYNIKQRKSKYSWYKILLHFLFAFIIVMLLIKSIGIDSNMAMWIALIGGIAYFFSILLFLDKN